MAPTWSARLDGDQVGVPVFGNTTLAEAIRVAQAEGARDPSLKSACAEGTCGACSVIVGGVRVLSCLQPALRWQHCDIQTATSFATGPIPQALASAGALQCGFCTPGFVVALADLQARGVAPETAAELAALLDANLCRCTGYVQLLEAGVAVLRRDPGAA